MKKIALLFTILSLEGCNAIGNIGAGDPVPPQEMIDPNNPPPVTPQPPVSCDQPQYGRRLLRRLTRGEYDRTIEDLLGIRGDYGERFAADTSVDGYDNHAEALVVAPLLADQLRLAAEDLSARAVENLNALVPCAAGTPDENCATELIRSFGERAYRRPLTETEVGRYRTLYRGMENFQDGIRWIIAAMLQSPNFLYRSEIGSGGERGVYRLSAYEIATELSYFITGSMPDPTLLEAAKNNTLTDPAVLEREAKRLFHSPRAKFMLSRFTDSWLELDRLAEVPKDAMTYPQFDAALREQMRLDTENFIARVVYEGSGTFSGLLTTTDGAPERVGLLAQPSLLSVHARPNSSSPVHRGKLVRERLLCQKLPPPPPGVVVQPPPLDPNLTSRERYARHASDPLCNGCHRMIDPIGVAFEHFDGAGVFRELENSRAIDDDGEIVSSRSTNTTFDGLSGLAGVLAESDEVRGCFVEHWFRFAYGLTPQGELGCVLGDLKTRVGGGDPSIEQVVVALAVHPHTQQRTGAPVDPMEPEEPMEPVEPEEPVSMPPVQEISVNVHEDSRWETGHCDQVTVTNLGANPLDWRITLSIEGTLTQHWNTQASATSGDVVFEGVSWNDVIAPGASAAFGYCAAL